MPDSPISRMKAFASAISWASCADQEPPARRCVGAKNTREAGILALDRGLEPFRQRLIRRVIAEKPALHASTTSILTCNFVDQIRKLPLAEQG